LTVGRRLALLGALLAVGCTEGRDGPPVAEEQLLPGGYEAAVDTVRGDPGMFQLTLEGDDVHIMTGPAGVAWRPGDVVEQEDFLAEATFTVSGAPPGYREAYGIFVGGRQLDGPAPRSTYLLVRPTGEFFVGQVTGDTTAALADWTSSDAVQAVRAHGDEPVNVLGILREGDEVRFLVNGTVVHTAAAATVDTHGIAGVRINHRLDVRVGSWYLGAPPLETPATSP
jgi:hypothetical protein